MKPRDIEFLYEMGTIRRIQRTWCQMLGKDVANLAEHTFRMMWIAAMIAKNEENVDFEKVIKLALVHDIAESRTGDVHYVSRQYTECNDDMAIKDVLEGTSLESEFIVLVQEYEARQTLESKIVKDADNLDVDMELREFHESGHRIPEQWRGYRTDIIRERLFTNSAKELFDLIYSSNPADWHQKSKRNRFNSGDWSKGQQS